MYYSVCVPAVLGQRSIEEALAAVRTAGFGHYEFWQWWNEDQDMDAYLAAQQAEGLIPAALCTKMIPMNDPAQREAYVQGVRETAEVCRKLGCRSIISQVGNDREGVSAEEQHENIVTALKDCISILEEYDLTLMIEPLNTKIDHIGYYMWSSEEAFEIVEEVNDPHVKMLFDLYHQHIMNDLHMDRILANMDKIAHFHVAGYPGRHEPLIDSEIDYPAILKAIRESGYQGGIGLEYFPVKDAEEGLKILKGQLETIGSGNSGR